MTPSCLYSMGIKEDFCTDTYAFFCGATFVPEFVVNLPKSNVVRRLQDAGAVIIGVTNMPELGTNSIGYCETLTHKHPRNPYNVDFFPGGSSSGSAVSVAAGLCPIALAGDGGGSARVPAAVCGQFGLKVTNDRIHEVGSYPSLFSFSVLSPISSSPLDIAFSWILSVILSLIPKTRPQHRSRQFLSTWMPSRAMSRPPYLV